MESGRGSLRHLFDLLESGQDPFDDLDGTENEDPVHTVEMTPGMHRNVLDRLPAEIHLEVLRREIVEMEFWLEFHLHAGDLEEVGEIARRAVTRLKMLLDKER